MSHAVCWREVIGGGLADLDSALLDSVQDLHGRDDFTRRMNADTESSFLHRLYALRE